MSKSSLLSTTRRAELLNQLCSLDDATLLTLDGFIKAAEHAPTRTKVFDQPIDTPERVFQVLDHLKYQYDFLGWNFEDLKDKYTDEHFQEVAFFLINNAGSTVRMLTELYRYQPQQRESMPLTVGDEMYLSEA
jgi:hypothetical protein